MRRRDGEVTTARAHGAPAGRLPAPPAPSARAGPGNGAVGELLGSTAAALLPGAAVAAARPAGNAAVARLAAEARLATVARLGAVAKVAADSTTLRRPVVVQRQPAPAITPQSVGVALATVQAVDTRKDQVTSLRPWEMFAYVPWNPSGGEKKRVFSALGKAYRGVDKAKATLKAKQAAQAKLPATAKAAKLAKAKTAVDKADAALKKAEAAVPTAVASMRRFIKAHLDSSRNPALADLKSRLAQARKDLARAQGRAAPAPRRRRGRRGGAATSSPAAPAGGAAQQAVATAQTAVTTLEGQIAEKLTQMRAEVDAADYTPTAVERTTTTWAVGDARATVYDKVEAYATVTASGLEGKAKLATAGGPTVADLLAKDTTLSASTKKILAIISEFEGQFSSLNTWDIADVTWGMVQWTTGAGGKGDLIEALKIVKADEPDAFRTRLQQYGIDVDNDGIVLTRPDGTVLHGLAAAKAVQASAQLSAVLSASGADPKIQVAQMKASYELEVRKPLASSVKVACTDGTKSVKVEDIVTSEAGVGALTNQTVHGGYPKGTVVSTFSAAAKAAGAKKADAVGGWSADAEKRLIEALRVKDPERVAVMKKRLDTGTGSFR